MKPAKLFGLHAEPGPVLTAVLAAMPFVVVVAAYWIASDIRHAVNPNDKLLPTFGQMAEAFWTMATQPDLRTGHIVLWSDTFASLVRLWQGVIGGAVVGGLLGINTALFPGMRASFRPFITCLSIIPPLTILPILFIVFGTGEEVKVILIFIGTVFIITRDILLATMALPIEQVTKALTLGASQLAVVYRIVLPQIMPRLINTTRLTLGAAWLFLIAAEMISAKMGLGYRIGLVRRYMAMDVIIPYVLWITLLGFLMDWLLRIWVSRGYPWYQTDRKS